MGKLVHLNEIGIYASWYFNDAWFNNSLNKYQYKWPNDSFPTRVHMHQDMIRDFNDRKIKIRKWIEFNTIGTVILDIVDLSYKRYYGKNYEWDRYYNVKNCWHRYHFEDSESALIFSVVFGEWIQPLTNWHPNCPSDETYLALPIDQRYKRD